MNILKSKLVFVIFLNLLICGSAFAAMPNYNPPEILARANITDGYNIPPLSFLSNTSPVINNHGDVAFKIMAVEGGNTQVLWVKKSEEAAGKIVYVAPDERFITDPSINDSRKIVFNLFDEGVTDGLFIHDIKTQSVTQVLNPDDLPIQDYTYPQITNNNQIYFRATDDNYDRSFYEFSGNKLSKFLDEGQESLGIKASYLFRPTANSVGQIAFKARIGEKGKWDDINPDSIYLLTPSTDPKSPQMKVVTIAFDKDTSAGSKYLSFGNSLSLSKDGSIAFIGMLEDSKKAIVIAKDNVLINFAVEGQNDIFEIEMFSPKINDQGLIAFRARDINGKRGIYIADGSSVKKIIGEGDDIATDLGAGKILFNPNYPGIGGGVDMNNQGEIVFYCLIVSSDNNELGSAIYKITPTKEL